MSKKIILIFFGFLIIFILILILNKRFNADNQIFKLSGFLIGKKIEKMPYN